MTRAQLRISLLVHGNPLDVIERVSISLSYGPPNYRAGQDGLCSSQAFLKDQAIDVAVTIAWLERWVPSKLWKLLYEPLARQTLSLARICGYLAAVVRGLNSASSDPPLT